MLTVKIIKMIPVKNCAPAREEEVISISECDVVEERDDFVYYVNFGVEGKRESDKQRFVKAYVMNDTGATVQTIYGKQCTELQESA